MGKVEIRCEGPTNLIYEFNGIFLQDANDIMASAKSPVSLEMSKEPLSLENTLWADTVLAS